jgi:hypothetical protein
MNSSLFPEVTPFQQLRQTVRSILHETGCDFSLCRMPEFGLIKLRVRLPDGRVEVTEHNYSGYASRFENMQCYLEVMQQVMYYLESA